MPTSDRSPLLRPIGMVLTVHAGLHTGVQVAGDIHVQKDREPMSERNKHHIVVGEGGVVVRGGPTPLFLFVMKPITEDSADHLTLAFPDGTKDPNGRVDVHLTRRRAGAKRRHAKIATFSLGDVERVVGTAMREFYRVWLAHTSQVHLDDAAFANAFTLERKDEVMAKVPERLRLPRGRYGFRRAEDLEDFALDLMRDTTVDVAHTPEAMKDNGPHCVLRVTEDDELENVGWLGYFPDGPAGSAGPSGWYLTVPFAAGDVLRDALHEACGPALERSLNAIRRGFENIDAV